MKLKFFTLLLILGGLAMNFSAFAQFDLDVDNQTSCTYTIHWKHDAGGCTITSSPFPGAPTAGPNQITPISTGASSGEVYQVRVEINGVSITFLYCPSTGCTPCTSSGNGPTPLTPGLPLCNMVSISFIPATGTTNAGILIQ